MAQIPRALPDADIAGTVTNCSSYTGEQVNFMYVALAKGLGLIKSQPTQDHNANLTPIKI